MFFLESFFWEDIWCFSENRHLTGHMMVRNNRNGTLQTEIGGSCTGTPCNVCFFVDLCWSLLDSLLHWSSLVFRCLPFIDRNISKKKKKPKPRGIPVNSSSIWLVELCCFCWIAPPLLIHVWNLLLKWTISVLKRMKSPQGTIQTFQRGLQTSFPINLLSLLHLIVG